MTLNTGQILQQRYHITSHIGQGGMGAVYQAQDMRLDNRLVAVKEFDPAQLSPSDRQVALRSFQQEAAILARLSHPGLTAVIDYFPEDNKFYLVMEFVEGETLEQAWERAGRRFAEAQVVSWAHELCDVLSYLHSQQPPIIFRDLKPGNIMVKPNGPLKLIDFGIARHFDPNKTSDTVRFGTPGYAAPEQYGSGQTDARSDVYALGVVTHQLLTGYDPTSTPFHLPPIAQLAPQVSSSVNQAVTQALDMDPEKRPFTVQAFSTALQADALVNKKSARTRWIAGLIVLFLLLLLGGGWLWRNNQSATMAPVSETVVVTQYASAPIASIQAEDDQNTVFVTTPQPSPTRLIKAVISTPTPPSPTPLPMADATMMSTATATPTPTAMPTPQPIIAFAPLSLADVANGEMDFASPPNGFVTLQNIPFQIEPRIFKSQAAPTPHDKGPTRALVTADLVRAYRLYLLLNTGNGFLRFNGDLVGRLNVICDGETYTVADLQLGRDIREWHSANNVVSSASQVQQIWQGALTGHPDLTGQIDMLTIDLPQACQDGRLSAVELIDTSVESVQSLDPALNLIAITAEHYE